MLYPIVFMLITCIVFVGVLAFMYRSSEAKIVANNKDSYQRLVLGLFAESIATATENKPYHIVNDYPKAFNKYVKEVKLPGVDRRTFSASVGDSLLGYCFEIGGKGLWGSMRALIVLSPDLTTLDGLVIYDQMETPGLGGRIGEQWFLDQFKNIPIYGAENQNLRKIVDFILIPEGKQATNSTEIQQITGATITSASVLKMLKSEIALIIEARDAQPVQR
jgi:Na+-transporting NADH:ubiquinone oxidoreductase subunit C